MAQLTKEQQDGRDAVAGVIRAAGFDAMAEQYLSQPEVRVRVLQAMRRNIARDNGIDAGDRFARLADQVQTMCNGQQAFAPVIRKMSNPADRESAMRSIAEAAAAYRARQCA